MESKQKTRLQTLKRTVIRIRTGCTSVRAEVRWKGSSCFHNVPIEDMAEKARKGKRKTLSLARLNSEIRTAIHSSAELSVRIDASRHRLTHSSGITNRQ